jgi:hypothetical protein
MTSEPQGRHVSSPVRFTLGSNQASGLDGAWWPYSVSIARELSGLTDALRDPLGEVIDIGVNWSPLQGVPDLDLYHRRGVAILPGPATALLRVMTITGSRARANLLVIPCRTSIGLAVMLLRQAADLPVMYAHQHTPAHEAASVIVRAARAQVAPVAAQATAQPESLTISSSRSSVVN